MKITLFEALKIIKSTIKLHSNDPTFPYFFIVGAGISCPEIPTAKNIVELCKKQLKDFDNEHYDIVNERLLIHSKDNMKYYSEWIRNAFPNKIDRSNFYKKLISDAKISSANLLLAQILNSSTIANTVFTTNFDDSLKKALNLIGCNHFVSENNMDNLVINNQTRDIQIVHVHGTYNFYDCANLDSEIDCVATQTGTISSSQLLSIFLSNQAPIIVGYSGWENDVIMHSLKERLKYATPLQYIWVCYDSESYQALPDWIRKNQNISFVIPNEPNDTTENSTFLNDIPQAPVIEAKNFFYKLIAELKIGTPLIFSDPHIYYSKMIDTILPENEDVLHLRNWARRMQLSTSCENKFEQIVTKMEDALIRNNFIEATKILSSLKEIQLNKPDIEFLYSTLIEDFIKKEEIVDSFETKYKFRTAVVSLIEANISTEINNNILLDILLALCFFEKTPNEKQKIIKLLERIRKISSSSHDLLEVELLSTGLLSVYIENISKRKKYLQEIIDRSVATTDVEILRLRCNALINLSKITQFSNNTLNMIEEAETLSENYQLSNLKIHIYLAKAIHLENITNPDILIVWLDEILSIIKNKNIEASNSQYTSLAALTSSIMFNENLSKDKKENMEEYFINYIDGILIDDISNTEFYNYVMCCTNILLNTDKNSIKYTYCQKMISSIFERNSLNKFLSSSLLRALYIYFELPNAIASYEDKSKKLIFLKSKAEYIEIYENALYYIVIMELNEFKQYPEFKDDIETIEKINNQISKGIELYTTKNFIEAEKCFKTASVCNINDISDIAKTNLSFMIRRNETSEELSFWDVIKDIKEPGIFAHLNVILYCIEYNETKTDTYNTAVANLTKCTPTSVFDAIDWWSNTEIVGEKESELALDILNQYFPGIEIVDFEPNDDLVEIS